MRAPLFPILAVLCFLLPRTGAAADKQPAAAVVAVPLANVREQPEPKARIVTQVLLADEVRILEKREYRYRIVVPNQGNREGWIHQEAVLASRDASKPPAPDDRPRVVVAAPKTPALIIDRTGNHTVSLYAGTRLPVTGRTDDGFRVQFPDRTIAVIPAADVLPVKPRNPVFEDVTPAEIERTARRFRGVRHFAGGLTAQGMDTQGLIYIVYRIHGIDLDLEGDLLAGKAARVSRRELEPGDIAVFHGEGTGLVLTGGRFLHSTKKGGAQLGGLHDRRYANALQYGLRVLGPDPAQKKPPAAMTADEIMIAQSFAAEQPLPRRIVFWAERFIGTPYDPDPLGLYVRTNRIVADEKADCMYLTFRAAELALTTTPGEAVDKALDLRFLTRGRIEDGLVRNYDDRFQYGEDMIWSGKWGRNVTAELGTTQVIAGSRGKDEVVILPRQTLLTKKLQRQLRDGDIVFWVKDPKKRVVEEIVAHLAFIRVKNGKPFLIHASGSKNKWSTPNGGVVKEVPFADYVRDMKFVGAFVTRFEP